MKQLNLSTALTGTLVAVSLATPTTLNAHKEPFGYLRGAQSEPRGEWEITQWTTGRVGKESGRYLGMDFATEVEYGVTDRLQTAVYLTGNDHFLHNATGSSEVFDDRNQFGLSGTKLEFKYQLSDPYRNWAGFSLYFEPGYSTIESAGGERHQEVELELRLIGQKNFFDNRLVAAVNYVLEPEFERAAGTPWATNLRMEWNAGLSWHIAAHWWIGGELRLVTKFEDSDLNRSKFLTFSAGPTVHYAGERFFATLTLLPQLRGWPNPSGVAGLHLDEAERLEIRLKLGAEF